MKTTIIDPSVLAGSEYAFPAGTPTPVGMPGPVDLGPTIATTPIPAGHNQMAGGPSVQPSQYSTTGPIPKG